MTEPDDIMAEIMALMRIVEEVAEKVDEIMRMLEMDRES